jgi:phage baseplate assembly protein W
MEDESLFLGTGWAFPPRFDFEKNTAVMVSEEEDIRESLRIIFSTALGERYMNPKFGSGLSALIFDGIDSIFLNRLKDYITSAILNFEPRITLDEINVEVVSIYEGKIDVHIYYTIRKINVRTNIVYPFYFKEGTNIEND